MKIVPFGDYDKETLLNLLLDAYSSHPGLTRQYRESWEFFAAFVYDNLNFMNDNGFISVEDKKPIGFFSWDSRHAPAYVQIGHNCIIHSYKGAGNGKEQLSFGLERMKKLHPVRIIVKTGTIPFFLPARKMYESAGFLPGKTIKNDDDMVPELILYELGKERIADL
jgi:hypothetical protein